jgi:hypothetical protein
MTNIAIENGPVEIVNFHIKHGGFFHSFLCLPEGKSSQLNINMMFQDVPMFPPEPSPKRQGSKEQQHGGLPQGIFVHVSMLNLVKLPGSWEIHGNPLFLAWKNLGESSRNLGFSMGFSMTPCLITRGYMIRHLIRESPLAYGMTCIEGTIDQVKISIGLPVANMNFHRAP